MKNFMIPTRLYWVGLVLLLMSMISCGQKEPGTLYLNIIWHQHQPSYLDATKDRLIGPWVRTHSTKDYYDMAAALEEYPKVHLTIDLTSVLLRQLQDYYVDRLGPYVDTKANRVNAQDFLAAWRGKTDPWIDLMLKDARTFNDQDLDYLFNKSGKQAWSCFSLTDHIIKRFPQYEDLIPEGRNVGSFAGTKAWDSFTLQQKRRVKFFFFLALFDPSFLKGRVTLPLSHPDGSPMVVDLSDLVLYDAAGSPKDDSDDSFTLRRDVTEEDCNRLVAEAYKVMANVIPVHQKLMYHPATKKGQIELITTPFYHPILPLIYDSDIAKKCQSQDPLPERFSYPLDAENQVRKGVSMFERIFGERPSGMWPAEGSVAEEVVPLFLGSGIRWIATGPHVLAKSLGKNGPDDLTQEELARMYVVDDPEGNKLGVVFRDLRLSDQIAFDSPRRTAGENVESFFQAVEGYLPGSGEGDRLLTVLLDGENAWEYFDKDNDGIAFLKSLYAELERRFDEGRIITVTPSEYLDGNPDRGVKPHPVEKATRIDPLFPASWFLPHFSNWIGEPEENTAWEYLLRTRADLENTGLPPPDPEAEAPKEKNTRQWYIYQAWEEMYAAEGSDWFWWYGADETAGLGGDELFDENYLLHLTNVYRYAQLAGARIETPRFAPILSQGK
jgi:alpha-amylase/alpha-mannosidase (GH57 family)